MKYFITDEARKESGSTNYIEFQAGKNDGKCWKEDSLYIHSDTFDELGLSSLLACALDDYDYYGVSEVSRREWKKLRRLLTKQGDEYRTLLSELEAFVKESLDKFERFCIWGM